MATTTAAQALRERLARYGFARDEAWTSAGMEYWHAGDPLVPTVVLVPEPGQPGYLDACRMAERQLAPYDRAYAAGLRDGRGNP